MRIALFSLLLLSTTTAYSATPEKFTPDTIIFIGSSTMGHWKPRMDKDFAGLSTWNFGENGTDFHYLHETISAWAKEFPAKRWVIYSGDNDLNAEPPHTPEKVSADMVKTVELLRAQDPAAEVYVISIKKRVHGNGETVEATNKLMAEAVAKMKDVIFVDTFGAMRAKGGDPGRFFDEDGVHLNSAGYDLWAETLRGYLLKKKQATEPSEPEPEAANTSAR